MKLGWRILNNPATLWVCILKAKYFAKDSFVQSSTKAHCPALWRGIQKIKPTLLQNSIWCVVNGENIDILIDQWIFQMSESIVNPADFPINISAVNQLISPDSGSGKRN